MEEDYFPVQAGHTLEIAPLDGRELFPDGQQIFALKLAYTFNGMS
jgi:hypothetical protein